MEKQKVIIDGKEREIVIKLDEGVREENFIESPNLEKDLVDTTDLNEVVDEVAGINNESI